MLDRRQTLAGAGAAALALAPTLAHAAPAGTQSEQADAYLDKTLTQQFYENVDRNPELATALGLDKDKRAKLRSKLNDYSLAEADKVRNATNKHYAELQVVKRDDLSLV